MVTIRRTGINGLSSRSVAFQSFPDFLFKVAVVLLCFWVTAGPGNAAAKDKKAEKPYALIYGTVWGPDARPVYGIKVKIRRADQKRPKWELYSDHRGEFAQRVPAGQADYIIVADLKGVKTVLGRPLRLAQEAKVHVTYDEREDVGIHLTY